MSVSYQQFHRACASCLLHDLKTACTMLSFHAKNPYNPYSLKFAEDIAVLANALHAFYREVDSFLSERDVEQV